jgi:hypothetical protein
LLKRCQTNITAYGLSRYVSRAVTHQPQRVVTKPTNAVCYILFVVAENSAEVAIRLKELQEKFADIIVPKRQTICSNDYTFSLREEVVQLLGLMYMPSIDK